MPAYTAPEAIQRPADAVATDPYDRYVARLEAHLADLPRPDWLPSLRKERTRMIAEFTRFCEQVQRGIPQPEGNGAVTFNNIIAELGKRIAWEERLIEAAEPMRQALQQADGALGMLLGEEAERSPTVQKIRKALAPMARAS